MKIGKWVLSILTVSILLSGCGSGSNAKKTTSTDANSLIQQANSVGEAARESATSDGKNENELGDAVSIINDCNGFLSDCWNPVCDLDWYTSTGTSSTGGELDPDFTIDKFEDAYADKDKYDSEMSSLPDDTYSFEKLTWTKAISEFDKIATMFQDRTSIINEKNTGTHLGIDYLEDYVHEFSYFVSDANRDLDSESEDEIIKDCDSFLSNCWNPICDLSWYMSSGTSATGSELDAEYTIQKIFYYYKDKDRYDKLVQGLSDNYSLAKTAWTKAMNEMDSINSYISVNEEKIINDKSGGSLFDVSKLEDYVRTFGDEAYK